MLAGSLSIRTLTAWVPRCCSAMATGAGALLLTTRKWRRSGRQLAGNVGGDVDDAGVTDRVTGAGLSRLGLLLGVLSRRTWRNAKPRQLNVSLGRRSPVHHRITI